MKKILTALLLILSLGFGSYGVLESSLDAILNADMRLRDAVYAVETTNGYGSGVLIAPELILTAAHVVQNANGLNIAGKAAVVLKNDPKFDLALVSVPGLTCPCIPLASETPRVDTPIIVIGYPLYNQIGFTQIRTEGAVQGYPTFGRLQRMMMSAPVMFGNSGGVVVINTITGPKVVGIVIAMAGASLGMYGVPVPHLSLAASLNNINELLHGS